MGYFSSLIVEDFKEFFKVINDGVAIEEGEKE